MNTKLLSLSLVVTSTGDPKFFYWPHVVLYPSAAMILYYFVEVVLFFHKNMRFDFSTTNVTGHSINSDFNQINVYSR